MWAAMAFAELGNADRAWELFALLNPVSHARDAAQAATYMVEPYVVAGDVYANAAHAGRGGWTWYTGSAGWMYQLVVEPLLGLRRSGNRLRVRPLLPKTWTTFEVSYRFGTSTFAITCREAAAGVAASVVVDGVESVGDTLPLVDDGNAHEVLINVAHRL